MIPSYDDLTPGIPDVLDPASVRPGDPTLFACLRQTASGKQQTPGDDRPTADGKRLTLLAVARDFSPRVMVVSEREVLLDVSGLGRLIGEESSWVAAHRLAALRRAVERFRCVVLLKGNDTIVAAPGEPTLVTTLSTPSLATAGTGDVLTGIVAAFLAKGMEAPLAAAAAAVAQNAAARLGPQAGLVASDVIARLPRALDER